MKTILAYLKPYRKMMTLSLTIKALATMIELALPYILSHIVDNVIKPLEDVADPNVPNTIRTIVIWAVVMIGCAALGVSGNIWANRMAARFAKDAARQVRHDLFWRTMTLSPAQTDAFTIPSLESRLTTDTYNIHNFINTMQRMGIRAPILLVGGLIVTTTLDPMLTLVMACMIPFIMITILAITKKGLPMYTKVQGAIDSMIRVVREDSQGIRVIKALTKQNYEYRRYDKVNSALADVEGRTNSLMSSTNPIMSFFMNLALVAVIFVGAHRVNGGLSDPGKIMAFIQYFTLISMAMMSITRIFVIYSKASASAARITEVLSTKEGLPVASTSDYPQRAGERGVVFDNVSFEYNGKRNTLCNISFKLAPGKKLGIIGATGSGKTTLTALIMRFYDVSSGSIRIDGRDVRTIPEDELHSMFGVAMQNDFIIADTIRENIRFGRDISDEAIEKAASIAQASEFIAECGGFDYMLEAKGANISGGQKQRLLIARAIASDPKILILDDSSSALDYKTDALLRRAISDELADTTTIIVAQRVSSVMNCDYILLLDEGQIIGEGTHETLMQTSSVYREISHSQMGGAILE